MTYSQTRKTEYNNINLTLKNNQKNFIYVKKERITLKTNILLDIEVILNRSINRKNSEWYEGLKFFNM